MMTLKIAFRNIFRNQRRSIVTLLTIAVGTAAALVFGAYVTYIFLALQTGTVQRIGHITVYRNGYFNFGSGNPSAYAIEDYEGLMQLISADPAIQPRLAVITATQSIAGIAGNFDNDTSKPFFGAGFLPSDRDRMGQWQAQGIDGIRTGGGFGLTDGDPSKGIVGLGLGRVLGLCEALKVPNCPQPPLRKAGGPKAKPGDGLDLGELASRDQTLGKPAPGATAPHIDLLAATAGGAPNVVTLTIAKAESQGVKELDDSYVGMHIALAQQLLYGRAKPKVTGVVLQLHRTADMEPVRQRLQTLFGEHKLDMEVRDFKELSPLYVQAVNLFSSIFFFISTIIGIVVLFTTTNTIGMSVMERIDEIGTTRALGLRRSGIRRQFLLEGALLGALGATAGVIFASLVALGVNTYGLTWTPPGQVSPVPLKLLLFSRWSLVIGTWVGLMLISTISAYFPANRAAKMPVVDALRHV
jgi:putative ABC transport system permease protein